MKNFCSLVNAIVVLLSCSSPVAAQWARLTPTYPATYRVADIAVSDSVIMGVGYRFTDFQGHIFRSFNGGVTWDTLQVPPAGFLFETIAFNGNDTAYIGGFGSITILLRTVDRGHTWAYYLTDTSTTGIDDMVFLDNKRGFASGYDTAQFYSGNCYYTSDGGNSWAQQTADGHSCLDSLGLDYIDFPDVQTGYAVSSFFPNDYLLKTTDTGKHWNIIHTQEGIGGVYFWNVLNGVMVAEGGEIFKTSDGGITWVPKPSPVTDPLLSVSFVNNNIGYAVGGAGAVIKTVDGGETWTAETRVTTQPLLRVKWFGGRAYATGDGGTILRSEAVLETGTLPLNYRLNVYPNPASTLLYITSTANQHFEMLDVKLRDISGHVVKTVRTKQTLTQLDVSDLATGVYTVTVNADGQEYREKVSIQH